MVGYVIENVLGPHSIKHLPTPMAIAKFMLINDSEISLMIKGADSSGAISLLQLSPMPITVSSPKNNVSYSSSVKSSSAESSPESDTKSLQSSQQDVSIAVSSLKIIDTTKPPSAKKTKKSSEAVVVIQTKNVTDNDASRNGVLVTVTRPIHLQKLLKP